MMKGDRERRKANTSDSEREERLIVSYCLNELEREGQFKILYRIALFALVILIISLGYIFLFSEEGYDTPLEAVQAFRSYGGPHVVIHEHDVDGGKVLFFHRMLQEDAWDFHAEYVKQTWRGWKWGYGGGHSVLFDEDSPSEERWSYQYFPSTEGTGFDSPFPMLYGVMDAAHHSVSIENHTTGEHHRMQGEIIDHLGVKLWYLFLTEDDGEQFTLTFLSEDNKVLDSHYINEALPFHAGDAGEPAEE